MITDLKPYPEMKDSSVPWLGEVPEHWNVKRLAQIGRFLKGNGGTKEDEVSAGVPCVRYGDLYTTHTFFILQSRSYIASGRESDYTAIRYGDILFAASGETIDEIGKSAVNLIPSAAYCGGDVILFRSAIEVNARFIGYATDCPSAAVQKATMGRGTTVKHIYSDQLKRLAVALPPPAEQAVIVRFLDHADRRIRRYIRAKQKLIKLLQEQKQAIIHHAVTRGLDPNVRLKPSGEAWLGSVPLHWRVASLRFRYAQCLGKMVDAKQVTGKHLIPYLRNVDVRWDRINTIDLPLIDIAPHEIERFTVRVGDLLVCEGRHLGRCAFWNGEVETCAFQKALHRLRPLNADTDVPRFLFFCMCLAYARDAFNMNKVDNTIPHLTGEMLRAHRFAFPPIEEQRAIAVYLDSATEGIESTAVAAKTEVALLREYRTRLIADVVTGKLDVRAAAAGLPDEVDEAGPFVDADAVEEDDEAVGGNAIDAAPNEVEV